MRVALYSSVRGDTACTCTVNWELLNLPECRLVAVVHEFGASWIPQADGPAAAAWMRSVEEARHCPDASQRMLHAARSVVVPAGQIHLDPTAAHKTSVCFLNSAQHLMCLGLAHFLEMPSRCCYMLLGALACCPDGLFSNLTAAINIPHAAYNRAYILTQWQGANVRHTVVAQVQ